jgi:uncharacterized Zn finger protein
VKAATWWGRTWLRAAEDAAYDDADVAAGWRIARSGVVGAIEVTPGRLLAAVMAAGEPVAASVLVDVLDAADREALVEVVAATSGRVAALLGGDLPTELAEHAEEAGISLVPSDFDCACTCGAWVQPCAHVLAVMAQTVWLLDADPLVLFALRGLPRDLLLAELDRRIAVMPEESDIDLDVAGEAAERAARLLDELG